MSVVAHNRTRLFARPAAEAGAPDVREQAREPVRAVVAEGRSRKRKANADPYFIPSELVPDGWIYQWCRSSVFGQPDISHQVGLMENGWTSVPANRHAGRFMPPGFEGAIDRGGLTLMERPLALTMEARAEETSAAAGLIQAQKEQLGLSLPEGFSDRHRGVQPKVVQTYERGIPQARQPIEPGA